MTSKDQTDLAPAKNFLEHTKSIKEKKYMPFKEAFFKVGTLPFPKSPYNNSMHFLARSIVGQQLSVKAAKSIWMRLESLALNDNKEVVDIITHENTERIRGCGISGNKAKALIALKTHYEENKLKDAHLKKLDHLERSKELQKIWGIGQWSCDMISIFYFNDLDILPLGDVGVQRGLKKILNKNKLEEAEIIRIGNKFKPYRSILSLYAWHILDNEDVI